MAREEQWLATVVPAQLVANMAEQERRPAAVVGIGVEVSVAGHKHSSRLRFHVTKSPPARFTGNSESRVEDGDLIVAIELEVTRAGLYILDANLWSGEGVPAAWSRFRNTLEVGNAWAELRFAGNAVLATAPVTPLSVRELRGLRVDETRSPDLERLVPHALPLVLGVENLDELSNAAWESDAKDRVVRAREVFSIQGGG